MHNLPDKVFEADNALKDQFPSIFSVTAASVVVIVGNILNALELEAIALIVKVYTNKRYFFVPINPKKDEIKFNVSWLSWNYSQKGAKKHDTTSGSRSVKLFSLQWRRGWQCSFTVQ